MANDLFAPLTVPGLLDLLNAVVEALDIPRPGSPGARGVRDRILSERAGEARIVLAWVLGDHTGAGEAAAHLRKRLVQRPVGVYLTLDQVYDARIARRAAAESENGSAPAAGLAPIGSPEPVTPLAIGRPSPPTDTVVCGSAAVEGQNG
jgi:hypothetical protein